MNSLYDKTDPLVFSADYTDYPVGKGAKDDLWVYQAWEQIQYKLNTPELQMYQKYGAAMYCACQLAVEQRSCINISYVPMLNNLLIGLSATIFMTESTLLFSSLSAFCSEVFAGIDEKNRRVKIVFVCEA